jgi:hypothetical protein
LATGFHIVDTHSYISSSRWEEALQKILEYYLRVGSFWNLFAWEFAISYQDNNNTNLTTTMTLSLRADDRIPLQSMDKWANMGGWGGEHYTGMHGGGMFYHSNSNNNNNVNEILLPQLMMSQGFGCGGVSEAPNQVVGHLESPRSLDSLLRSSNSSSMADSTSEMNCCATTGDDGEGQGATSQIPTTTTPLLQSPTFLSSRGRGKSKESGDESRSLSIPVASADNNVLKRQFEEPGDVWGEKLQPSPKLPKRHAEDEAILFAENFQDGGAASGYNNNIGEFAGMSSPVDPLANLPPTPFNADTTSPAMAGMRSILFPAPLQVPSMEEIAKSRPKRRNVKISKDPQSVAARHRRERISDRIRVLQRLVPGGTKMDTASMLDEAIHYVKFLKLQLQTLEQIGNNCDAQFGAQIANAARPFDLNCAAYQQASPCPATTANMVHQFSSPSSAWPGPPVGASPFCGQVFPDTMQEQFCH